MNVHATTDADASPSPRSEPVQQVVINSLNTAIVLLNHELEVMLRMQRNEAKKRVVAYNFQKKEYR